jgi:phytoene/squalene synthetase/cytochrome P450
VQIKSLVVRRVSTDVKKEVKEDKAEKEEVAKVAEKMAKEEAAASTAAADVKSAQAKDQQDKKNPVSVAFRILSAGWDAFVELGVADPSKKPKWEYRKGIEGMSIGSMQYEMMTTDEKSEEGKALKKEYEKGWGFGFAEVTPRSISQSIASSSKAAGLDKVYLTLINLLQTVGLEGVAGDGIPVQNKWIDIVKSRVGTYMESSDSSSTQTEIKSMINYMVTGQMEKIAGSPMPVFLEQYGARCGMYKIVIGPRSVVVTSDPVVIKHILQGTQENYTKGILSEVLEPIMGKGLIPADPETWRVRRRAIVPGFHKKWLRHMTEVMATCTDTLCNDLDKQLTQTEMTQEEVTLVDMEEKFTSVSLDMIGQAVFSYDFGSVKRESPILKAVYSVLREAERRAQSVIPYWDLPYATTLFKDQKNHKENLDLLNAVLDELIKNAMEAASNNRDAAAEDMSMLQFLVQSRNEDVSTKQLRDDLMTLLVAGHETTAALLTWITFELSKAENKKAMDELKAEVKTVLGNRRITYDDIEKMPFMRACLAEALRLYPQPPILIRRCVDGDDCPTGPTCSGSADSVRFLPGQDIFISTWSLQRSEDLWGEDANKFNPWRWEKNIEGKGGWNGFNPQKVGLYPNEIASDFAFLPFGGGARKCVGDQFALLEATVVMAAMIQRYEFEWVEPEGSTIGMVTGATVHTSDGLVMKVAARPDFVPEQAEQAAEAKRSVEQQLREAYKKKVGGTVAKRIEPEAMVIPTAKELRGLFQEQAQARMEVAENQDEINAAYIQCQEVTREYSKTFYLGSQLLGLREQQAVWAIYNWCRCTDELVDGPEAAGTTMEDLEAWERKLQQIFDLKETGDSMDLALIDSVRNFRLIPRPFQDMVGGMAMDLVKERYQTFFELEVYCYRVAGTVGLMTLPILGFDSSQNYTDELKDATIDAALCLGLAFQLTNILRDVGEDARRGRIYVPLDDLEMFGIDEEDIFEAAEGRLELWKEERWKQFMEFQMARCNGYYQKAKNGIIGLAEDNRLGVYAALEVYGGILDVVRRNQYNNFTTRAYVSLAEKFGLMAKSFVACQKIQAQAEENIRAGNIFKQVKEARMNTTR